MQIHDSFSVSPKLPPNNLDVEAAILGGILLNPAAIEYCHEFGLKETDFYLSQHRQLYKFCLWLNKKGLPTDFLTVTSKLHELGNLDSVGGQAAIADLMERCISTSNIDQYVDILREKSLRRDLISFGHDLAYSAHREDLDLTQFITEFKDKFQLLAGSYRPALGRSKYELCMEEMKNIELSIDDAGERVWMIDELAHKYGKSPSVLKESFLKSIIGTWLSDPLAQDDLEREYGSFQEWLLTGWIPQRSLALLHALGGTGKTLFVQNLIWHLASGQDWGEFEVRRECPVLYIQTDTAPPQMLRSIKKRGITKDLPIRYHVSWQVEQVAALRRWVSQSKPGLVVIDSVTSVNKNSIHSENDTEYARFLLYMREIANEFGCSFLLIHHSNSDGESRGTKTLHNSVDEVWKLEPENPRDTSSLYRVLTMQKSRSRSPMRYRLCLDASDNSWECLGDADAGETDGSSNHSARERILAHMRQNRGTRFTYADLGEQIETSVPTVRKELQKLVRESLVEVERNPSFTTCNKEGVFKNLYVVY